jgi:Zn-dependent protease
MQGLDIAGILRSVFIFLPPAIFAITVHEVAHGWVAKRHGDPTALFAGRLTLNPVKHVDPIGTIVVPLALYYFTMGQMTFGWAKPVPVAFNNLNNPRRDMIIVAAAGPIANLLMALAWSLIAAITVGLRIVDNFVGDFVFAMCSFGIQINIILAVFNLVPIPPLDGGRVLAGLLPPQYSSILDRIEPFGILIVLVLLYYFHLFEVLAPLIVFLQNFYGAIIQFLVSL